ncbi:hypothetical protein BO78DRAFT_116481 [Aspergillus sclerotiicarbonarius CBS 121057]|uniref:Uncharacterized protein n=1 Tax=Aspergillus sclerotiicarbonarius (strain CBS 121057 / IBT 28362) TaxID=1448318 RepID=A0A319ES10_ASPSB|nr:hypothetical protein BO78DRAFT_116481 [Aspergillus sclerotiicarbonarius CBS 121057]
MDGRRINIQLYYIYVYIYIFLSFHCSPTIDSLLPSLLLNFSWLALFMYLLYTTTLHRR